MHGKEGHQKRRAKERQNRQKRQKARKDPRLHAENVSDAPLTHERQKVRQKQRGSVRRCTRVGEC